MTTDVYAEPRWIDIPSVNGMTVSEASERLTDAGFTPVASPRRFTADKGDIVGGTLPPEGSLLFRTAKIDLLPAIRPDLLAPVDVELTPDQLLDLGFMPNLAGWTGEDAIAFVERHGFIAWPKDAFTDTVDRGFVVITEPRPGASVLTGGVIQIFVAVPSPPVPQFVPRDPPVILEA